MTPIVNERAGWKRKLMALRKAISTFALILLSLSTMAVLIYAFIDLPTILRDAPPIDEDAIVVGLVSDVHHHLPIYDEEALFERAISIFRKLNVSLIIHAGDIKDLRVVRKLEKVAPVVAVHGNIDPPEIRRIFPEIANIEVRGWRIGVTHDVGPSWILGVTEKAERLVEEYDLDVLIVGHYHRPFVRGEKGVLYVCPGSPVDPLPPLVMKPTVGLLVITDLEITPIIIEV